MGLFSKYKAPDTGEQATDSSRADEQPIIDDELGPLWPPSPKVQVLLISIAFVLLNVVLIAAIVIVFWQRG